MANCKILTAVTTLVILLVLEASTCAEARHHAKRDPCSGEDGSVPDQGTPHNHRKPGHCPGTPGTMTLDNFDEAEGAEPAECDGKFHRNRDMIVALSTRWYAGGRRCHKPIRITSNGRTVEAIVVDECDSKHGCQNNIVVASDGVWKALGLYNNMNEELITWSDA